MSGTSPLARDRGRVFTQWSLCAAVSLGACACTSAPPEPLDLDRVAESVRERDTSAEELQLAFELAARTDPAVAVDAPAALRADDPRSWTLLALAYHPRVRQQRLEVERRTSLARSAGAPGPIGLEVDNMRFATSKSTTQWMLGFDVLSLLGVGRSAAAEELAEVDTRLAWAQLEDASFDACFEVQRSLVSLCVARARCEAYRSLAEEAAPDSVRVQVFEDRGWLPAADFASGRGTVARLESARAIATADEVLAVAQLARACGLPVDSPWYSSVDPAFFARLQSQTAALEPELDARTLLDRLPSLRALVLEYAVEEAQVRLAVSKERWPDLRLGPQLMVMPDNVLPGGMLDVKWPFPGSQRGLIEAALVARTRAREKLEDALLSALSKAHEAQERCRAFERVVEEHARHSLEAAQERWQRSRALFAVDPAALDGWSMALDQLRSEWNTSLEATERWWIARLDAARSSGRPLPEVRS